MFVSYKGEIKKNSQLKSSIEMRQSLDKVDQFDRQYERLRRIPVRMVQEVKIRASPIKYTKDFISAQQ